MTWVSVAFTDSSAGRRQPWVPGSPLLLGSQSQVVGCPESLPAGMSHHGNQVADTPEGLPSMRLAYQEHLANAHGEFSGCLKGAVKTLESNSLVLSGENQAQRGAVRCPGSHSKVELKPRLLPPPHTRHLVAVFILAANDILLQDARAGAQRGRLPVHRDKVQATFTHQHVLWDPGHRGCSQYHCHSQL